MTTDNQPLIDFLVAALADSEDERVVLLRHFDKALEVECTKPPPPTQ